MIQYDRAGKIDLEKAYREGKVQINGLIGCTYDSQPQILTDIILINADGSTKKLKGPIYKSGKNLAQDSNSFSGHFFVTDRTIQNTIIKNAGVSLCQIQERYRFLLFQIEGSAQLQMLLWRFLPQGSLIRY